MKLKRIIPILISVVILIFLFRWIDFSEVIDAITHANYYLLALAVLIVTINRIIMAGKWNILLRKKNIHISLFEATKIYYIANFLGLYLPPTIGTDIVRGHYVARKKHAVADVFSSIFVERLIGLLVLMMFAIIGGVLLFFFLTTPILEIKELLVIIVVMTGIALLLFMASLNQRIYNSLMGFGDRVNIQHKLIGKILSKLKTFYTSYFMYRNAKGALFTFFLLTCVEVVTYIRGYS